MTESALRRLNREFYHRWAPSFDRTRRRPWRGWSRVIDPLCGGAAGRPSILDLGCGNARLATLLAGRLAGGGEYLGLDGSPALLDLARRRLRQGMPGDLRWRLVVTDLLEPLPLRRSPGRFDLVCLFGVLHHVPGETARTDLAARAAAAVRQGGRLALSFWQLGEQERLARRAADPVAAGLAVALEAGDYLIPWGGEDGPLRYCHWSGPEEAERLVETLGLVVESRWTADGPADRSNLYYLLRAGG